MDKEIIKQGGDLRGSNDDSKTMFLLKKHYLIIFILFIFSCGDAFAEYELGPQFSPSIYPELSKSQNSSQKSTRTPAKKNNKAQSEIATALRYLDGDNRAVDEPKAFRLLTLAEQNGNTEASVYLASMYYYGRGTKQNYDEALVRFRKAALAGNTLAQFNLHVMYDVGYGVLVNKQRAFVWLLKAAEGGFTKAQTKLGKLYKTGSPVVMRDLKKSIEWFHRAAENGDKEGQFQLAKNYAMGIGTERNDFVSFVWFNIAIDQCETVIKEQQQCIDYTTSIGSTLSAIELRKANRLINTKRNNIAKNSNNLTVEKVIVR